ncbi:hypothetical protein QBC42DRAFT_23694 [Cladorrhinum samala]|uniref:Secreted protein n=1 Tax=Cladorrhinum samala TaxID=585594 RepID=A0AAV9HDF2_9PEZI|nr:hypothetical protein QBC42DRAFT_23694 [Cladorrhinum samala]
MAGWVWLVLMGTAQATINCGPETVNSLEVGPDGYGSRAFASRPWGVRDSHLDAVAGSSSVPRYPRFTATFGLPLTYCCF